MAGSLPLDDGRYLIRSGPAERVLVTETEGALPPPRRRRRRPRKSGRTDAPVTVSVTVATVVLADQPLDGESAAEDWLDRLDDSDFTGDLIADAIGTLDRARAADAAASGAPFGTPTDPGSILAARIGYGEGEQVASGRFLESLDVDARGGTAESRRQRLARTAPLARTAAILGAWTIVASMGFAPITVLWLGFAAALGFAALGIAGLIVHEYETERVVHELEVVAPAERGAAVTL